MSANSSNSGNSPKIGDRRFDLGIWFEYDGKCWHPAELLKNVITQKNAGHDKLYMPHPVSR